MYLELGRGVFVVIQKSFLDLT